MRHRTRTPRKPATTRLTRRLAIAGVLTALVTGAVATPATAATHRENVLRDFCAGPVTTSCVSIMDDDDGGMLQVRDRRGHRHTFTTGKSALRYLRHHAPACKLEDSPRCYWDAAHRGNDVGFSFIDVGGRAVFYLGNLD